MIEPHNEDGTAANGASAYDRSGWPALESRVRSDFERAGAGAGGTLSVIVAGLDDFRTLNDFLGPDQGDGVLQEFASCMSSLAGAGVEFSGDKFAVSLPNAGGKDAVSVAERVREAAASRIHTAFGGLRVSLGVAASPDGAEDPWELVFGAESALHWAKATGGDKVGYWTEIVSADPGVWKRRGMVADPVAALVAALEWKTRVESGQTARSAWYARRVGDMLRLAPAEQELIEVAGYLHDVGKLGIPDHILQKPGALAEREKFLVRQHPLVGRAVLKRIPALQAAADIVAHHHEHFDGSGYPLGLRGEQIPIGARIILVADAFDAMTTHRAYRNVLSLQTAVRELERCGGRQFDPRVVEAFVQTVSKQGLNALHWSHMGAAKSRRG